MVDLHCHILPGIDDGAKTLQDSIELLKLEKAQGIKSVALTPHFDIEKISLEDFCALRNESLELLKSADEFFEIGITVKTGAEVYYSPKLYNTELSPLCIEDTDYILIELPVSSKPYELSSVLQNILSCGYTPILAHIERYKYFAENPILLYDLVTDGCLAQINARAIIGGGNISNVSMKYLNWGLAQIICSDCHSVEHRSPNTEKALTQISRKLGNDYSQWIEKNCNDIFDNKSVDLPLIQKPKKILGFWK